jgi:hypothetical protein
MVTIVSGHGQGVVTADTVNLGAGGMFLATETAFDIGDRFICRIDLGDPYRPVLSGAEVRWVGSDTGSQGVGVQFLDIAEAAESLSGEQPTRGPEVVRVRLPSVGPSLEAKVVERQGKSIVIEFDFPFLEPGTQVQVGPDLSARTATIRSASWIDDAPKPMRIALELDVEPTSVEVAAGHVVADRKRQLQSNRKGFWQLPAKIKARRKAAEALEEPDCEAEVSQKTLEATEGEARELAEAKRKSREEAEERVRERAEAKRKSREEAEAPRTEEPSEEPEADELEVRGGSTQDTETATTDERPTEGEGKKESRDEAQRAQDQTTSEDQDEDDPDEEFDPLAFNPIRGQLERILGAAAMARLLAAWGAAKEWVGERINGPKLHAAFLWCKGKAHDGGRWAATKIGPVADRAWKGAKGLTLLQKARKQSRGEPSSVVRHLTDRARKVAAHRGRTATLILLITLGTVGLAAAGYGLTSSDSAETERESLHQEAEQGGWTTGRWEEPEPVEPATNS